MENELEQFINTKILPMLYKRSAIWKKRGVPIYAESYKRAAQGVKDELERWRAQDNAPRGNG